MEPFVDEEGRIHSHNLTKGLGEAIEEDRERKLIDETKKRVVLTAKSYDEFRHLVASVHQKRVSRSDIESLREEHKGWHQHTHVKRQDIDQEAVLDVHGRLEGDNDQADEEVAQKLLASDPSTYRSTLELKRDWQRNMRRVSTEESRLETGLSVLWELEWKPLLKLVRQDLDLDFLTELLACLFPSTNTTTTRSTMTLSLFLFPVLMHAHRFDLHFSLANSTTFRTAVSSFLLTHQLIQPDTMEPVSYRDMPEGSIDGSWLRKKGSRYLESVLGLPKAEQPSFENKDEKYRYIAERCVYSILHRCELKHMEDV